MSRIQNFILPVLVVVATLSATVQADEYPEATATSKPNVVISPFPPNKKIDITGFLPGDLARDPHTNSVFRVPAKKPSPLVFKPEIIEDDPLVTPKITGSDPDSLPIRRPEIVGEPDPSGPGRTVVPARPPAVPEFPIETGPVTPIGVPAATAEPEVPTRAPREIDVPLVDFVKMFIRNGQNDDPAAQIPFLAPKLTTYYSVRDVDHDRVKAIRQTQIAKWPRRIYVVSGKPRFVRWISAADAEDEFVIDVRVYQSLKDTLGDTTREYADHRLAIHEKADGKFEITGVEERHPRSVLADE